jgi:hypothetical protein
LFDYVKMLKNRKISIIFALSIILAPTVCTWVGADCHGGWLGCLAGTGQLATASQTAKFRVRVCAGLEPADGEDLVPGPSSDGEGAGAAWQDGVWAVVGLLQGWEDAVAVHPDEGNGGRRETFWQLATRVVFARQRKSRSI